MDLFDSGDPSIYRLTTAAPGPPGHLPIQPADLLHRPSGDIFGWTQDVGMGWQPADLRRPEMLLLSTQGGIREPDGSPLALGYHTGHWEVGLLMRAAAEELRRHHCMPFAGFCTDPCDGRTQGTTGMMDSLPFRNDAAVVPRPAGAASSSARRRRRKWSARRSASRSCTARSRRRDNRSGSTWRAARRAR